MQTIEIDCAPGSPRPGDLLPGVLKDTGIPVREPAGMFFGNWTWDYSDVPEDVWETAKPTIAARLKELYARGVVRYASW